jgi:hypothetical protein
MLAQINGTQQNNRPGGRMGEYGVRLNGGDSGGKVANTPVCL